MRRPRRRKNETEEEFVARKEIVARSDKILYDPKYSHKYDDNCSCEECSERFRRVFTMLTLGGE